MQNAQGKGQTWFPGKTCVDVEVRYLLKWGTGSNYVTEAHAAKALRYNKQTDAPLFTVTREARQRIANACAYCGARPRRWDWDCDGKFEDAVCDSEQCAAGRRW